MKKRDIILGVVIIAIGLIMMLLMRLYHSSPGNEIMIKVNGKKYGTYSLEKNQEIDIDTEFGHNVVCIEDGKAYMKEADCPDGYCKRQGSISRENQTIVCLPHKLVVEIKISNRQEPSGFSDQTDKNSTDDEMIPDAIVK